MNDAEEKQNRLNFYEEITLLNTDSYLVEGTNTIAV